MNFGRLTLIRRAGMIRPFFAGGPFAPQPNRHMLHSEYTKAAQAAIAHVKANVRYRGLNTAGGWIRNPIDVPQKFAARIKSLQLGASRSEAYGGAFDGRLFIDELAKLGLETQTGNCSELSAVAFKHLEAAKVLPIDYFGVYRGRWDHAFVVLNRDPSIPISDFAKWSYQAVVCDPLYDRCGDAGRLATWYPKMFPLKKTDVMYRVE